MENHYHGTTRECLDHYAATLPPRGSPEEIAERTVMRTFVQVSPKAPLRWLYKGEEPTGMNLFRLWLFLETKGYRIEEMEQVHRAAIDLGRLLVSNTVQETEIVETLELPHTNGLTRYIVGSRSLNRYRNELAELIIEEHRSSLIAPQTVQKCVVRTRGAVKKPRELERASCNVTVIVKSIAHLVNGLLPLVEIAASNAFSAKEREMIREEAGYERVFQLSNALHQLCGEKARELFLERNNKKRRS